MTSNRLRQGLLTIIRLIEVPLSVLDRLLGWAIAISLIVMASVLFFNAVGRSFGFSFEGGSSLARLLVIWLTFIGSYLVARAESHISVDMLSQVVTVGWQRYLKLASAIVGMLTTSYLAWLGYTYTSMRFASGQVDQLLSIKSAHFYLPVPVGCGLMALAFSIIVLRTIAVEPSLREEALVTSEGHQVKGTH